MIKHLQIICFFFFSSRRRHTRYWRDWSSDVCSSDLQSLSIVHEALSMMRVIIAFTRESHEQRRFREQGETAVDARIKVTVRSEERRVGKERRSRWSPYH